MFKPWLAGNIRDITRSTKRDYPAKVKKFWLAGNFPEGEHFHEGTYRPFPHPVLPPIVRRDGCAGRVLRPLSQVEWASGEGGLPKDGDVKELQAGVSGAVGEVTYSMDPFWSEVNEDGDVAIIDPVTGLITLEEGVCQGSYPPWIIYQVCDDCGCSSGTIWLEDSSDDCCGGCDCEDSGADCYENCCITEDGTPEEITAGGTKQYTCGGGGTWSVSGVGLSIDQTGLLTADAGTACGTGIVSNSVCQDVEVRVQGNGSHWAFLSDTNYSSSIIIAGGCNAITGGNCTEVSGSLQTKSFWTSRCACDGSTVELPGLPACASSSISCTPTACGALDPCTRFDYITRKFINEWVC